MFNFKASKRVPAYTAGSEKTKISVAFCASASGCKLPPAIIIPPKHPLKDFTPPKNVIIFYKNKKATFDHDVITNVFLKRVLVPHIARNNQKSSVIYLNALLVIKSRQLKTRVSRIILASNLFRLVLQAFCSRLTKHGFLSLRELITRNGRTST